MITCPTCGGEKFIRPKDGSQEICPDCGGSGQKDPNVCGVCDNRRKLVVFKDGEKVETSCPQCS
tara:strand:- start:630 stop:821 length:192 start_codon:yes stop_codon:yes gene_type:complete